MAYKTPIICKDIYLPIPSETLTFAQYNEKYGVDLESFIDEEAFDPHLGKVYLVDNENYLFNTASGLKIKKGVFLASGSFVDEAKLNYIYLGFNLFDKDGEVTTNYFNGVLIDSSEKTISPVTDMQ